MKIPNGIIKAPLPAVNLQKSTPAALVIQAGTAVTVVAANFEWLGNEGLYSDIVVDERPECRFRVRSHQLNQALGRRGIDVCLKRKPAATVPRGSSANEMEDRQPAKSIGARFVTGREATRAHED